MPVRLSEKQRESLHYVKGLLEVPNEHYTINALVRKSGMNADKVKKGFKELFGMPVHRYHLHFKMETAKQLLADNAMQVAEVADALGYADANNFSAAFKRVAGMRPGEWRKGSEGNRK